VVVGWGEAVGWVEPSGLAFGKPKDRLRETHQRRRDRELMGFASLNPSYEKMT
jgi:hypothetical protein